MIINTLSTFLFVESGELSMLAHDLLLRRPAVLQKS